jgi:hypothetical protein
MKAATDDIRPSNRARLSRAPAGMRAERLRSSDAIADGETGPDGDGGTGSVAANSSGSATLVAMVQTADLRKGDDSACGRRLYGPRLWTIFG